METTTGGDSASGGGGGGGSRRYGGLRFSPSSFLRAPISALMEHTGILRTVASRSSVLENDSLIGRRGDVGSAVLRDRGSIRTNDSVSEGTEGEVSIRIIGLGDRDDHLAGVGTDGSVQQVPSVMVPGRELSGGGGDTGNGVVAEQNVDGDAGPREVVLSSYGSLREEGEARTSENTPDSRDELHQRYDLQQVARWMEQILPFSLLLLAVFIRQHMQGFFVTIWITAVMFKSNDILRKQTALKGERKISVLVAFTLLLTLHVVVVYWWHKNEDLLYPLFLLPPKAIPPFWHAIYIIMVNDMMVRQVAMVVKLTLLMYYKNSRGRNYHRQGQMLTLVEYLLLLYRALLPAPVWYRFFLNKEYGSLFSSLTTGLYLTFKLTSVVEKVRSFFTAFRSLAHKEVQYGSYATSEQVVAAGDLCAICQEKIHTPVLLRCKHIFCEDCVSEWFERERTCPLCRALVKSAELRSFGDGSTSLFLQLF